MFFGSATIVAKNKNMTRSEYIKILNIEFAHRKKVDIFYSLRKFAFDLEIDFSHLGYVLRNERGLSRRKAEMVALKLTHLNYQQRKEFLLLVSACSARSRFERNLARMGLKNKKNTMVTNNHLQKENL